MTNVGDVLIDLDGETFRLQCTIEAFETVPALFDGFVGALRRVAVVDIAAVSHLIAIGTGKGRDEKERKRIAAKLFNEGLDGVLDKTTEWLGLLSAGGRKRKEAAEVGSGNS